jgi:cbb3-type cytochrome oxidase subunit 3
MNPTIPEETAQTARSLIDAFKANPGMLALVVFNLIFIAVVFYVSQENRTANSKLVTLLLEQHQETAKMLYNCTPNAPRG